MKKVSIVFALLLMCVSLVFAGGAAEVKKSNEGPVKIDVWHSMEGSNGKAMSALIAEFNATKGKELGIYANDLFQGSDTAVKLKTCIQTNDIANMPDVCQVYNVSLPVVASTPCSVDIDSMWGKGSASVSKTDIIDNGLYCFTYGGKLLSMPFNCSTLLIFCNLDAFAEIGLTEADIPRTWDQVVEVARKLAVLDAKGNVVRYGLNLRFARYEVINIIGAMGLNGTPFGNNNNGRDALISKVTCADELLKSFQLWEDLTEMPGTVYDSGNDQNNNFASGLNAMVVRSSAGIGAITKLTDANGMKWAVGNIPVFDLENDKGGAALGGASLAMFDRGDEAKKNAAWEFIMWMVSAGSQCEWSMATGYLPVNKHTQDLDEYKAFVAASPAVAIALNQNAHSLVTTQEPVMNMQSEIGGYISTAATDIKNRKVTPQEAVARVIKESEAAFEEYNRANR